MFNHYVKLKNSILDLSKWKKGTTLQITQEDTEERKFQEGNKIRLWFIGRIQE